MPELRLPGRESVCRVLDGDARALLADVLGGRRAFVVSDAGVATAHPELVGASPHHLVGQGEQHKTLASVAQVADALLAAGADRGTVLVGVGGGLVCDLAGYVASTWMRGCPLVLVPTTLLAQVDAALGGKTAVNHAGVKNLLGTFAPAEAVVVDPTLLATLPPDLLLEGAAELIKHALIADAGLLAELERAVTGPVDAAVLGPFVPRAAAIKAALVQADPREQGERVLLNLGHTLGHALEAATGLRHGRAVAVGTAAALRVSVAEGLLAAAHADSMIALLDRAGLPTSLAACPGEPRREELVALMSHDKKVRDGRATWVLLDAPGHAVARQVPVARLAELVDAVA